MREISYDPGRLFNEMAKCGGLGLLFLIGFGSTWFGGVLGVLLLLAALLYLLKTGGSKVALRFDREEIFITTLWKTHRVPWRDVVNIQGVKTTFYAAGFIPTNKLFQLVFHVKGGMLGTRKIYLNQKLLGLGPEEAGNLIATLLILRSGTGFADASFRQAVPPAGTESAGQDVDAMLARYFARKNREAQARPAAPVAPVPRAQGGSFGRRTARP